MTTEPHPNEPNVGELKLRRHELYTMESTPENLKKIEAIEAQLKQRTT